MTPSDRLERIESLGVGQSTMDVVADWALAEHGWRVCRLVDGSYRVTRQWFRRSLTNRIVLAPEA